MSGQRVRRSCRYTVAFVHCELMAQRQAAQAAGGSLRLRILSTLSGRWDGVANFGTAGRVDTRRSLLACRLPWLGHV